MQQINGIVLDHNPEIDTKELLKNTAQLENLKVLLLRENKLSKLPSDLKGFKKLAVLELSGNHFPIAEQERIKMELPTTNVVF